MTRLALAAPPPAERFVHWRRGPVTLYLGDALTVLTVLPPDSVDIVVTSPPYYGLRDYGIAGQYGLEATPQLYVQTMRAVFDQVRRVLRPAGTLWLNMGDGYSSAAGGAPQSGQRQRDGRRLTRPRVQDTLAPKNLIGMPWRVAFALQADGWYLRQSIIWHKPNSIPESVTDRPSCNYEYVFLLARSRRYYFNLDAIRTPLARPDALDGTRIIGGVRKGPLGGVGVRARRRGVTAYGAANPGRRDGRVPAAGHRRTSADPKGRNPGSVWSISTRPYRPVHVAVLPLDLPLACIAAGCPPDGRVLDPFSGAATTGLAALQHGCQFWGIDLNADYHRLAHERILRQMQQLSLSTVDEPEGYGED